jgi:CNT family concentrative nucleoside transporter
VLLAYQRLLGDTSSILTACVMSIPTSLLVSKIRYPEREEPITKGNIIIPKNEEEEANILHAASNGSAIGIQISVLMVC